MHPSRARGAAGPMAGALLPVLMAGTLIAPAVRAERIDLDLYERVALAPLVVRGKVDGEPQRLARVSVLEILKGGYDRATLQVAYRIVNFERPYGQEKIVFQEGEEALLFLVPLQRANGKGVYPDRFILFKGPDGKISLPAEGRQAWMDASRRLARLALIEDSAELFDALRQLVGDRNPLLVEIGLRQARKHSLVDERLLPALLDLVNRPDGRFRAQALDLAASFVRNYPTEAPPLAVRDHLVGLATLLADEAPEVATRRAAVRLLASDGTPTARAKLEAIAEADPSQDVRYEAAVAAYRLRSGAPFR